MLQSMHEKAQGWVSILIVASISILFALWGISYYLTPSISGEGTPAEVNGEAIREDLYQKNVDHAVQMLGLNEPTEALKKEVLQQLVRRTLFMQLAREEGFVVSDEQVESSILQIPAFEEGGSFSQTKFEMVLRRLGLTTSRLKQEIAENLNGMQLDQGIQATTLVLPHELNTYIRMALQTRDLRYVMLPFDSFAPDVITEESLRAYYQDHHADLISDNQIEVDYVVLDRDEIMRAESVDAEAAQKIFQERGEKMAELAFENPSSLQSIIDVLHLTAQESPKLYHDASKNDNIFRAQDIMNMIMSDAVLGQDNSGLIPLSDTAVMVVHQKNFYPSHELSFEEARARMTEQLSRQSSAEKARQFLAQVTELKKAGKKEEAMALFAAKNAVFKNEEHITRSDVRLSPAVSNALWSVSSAAVNEWVGSADEKGVYLIELLKVTEPSDAEIEKDQSLFTAGLSMLKSQMFLSDSVKQKEQHADIQIHL